MWAGRRRHRSAVAGLAGHQTGGRDPPLPRRTFRTRGRGTTTQSSSLLRTGGNPERCRGLGRVCVACGLSRLRCGAVQLRQESRPLDEHTVSARPATGPKDERKRGLAQHFAHGLGSAASRGLRVDDDVSVEEDLLATSGCGSPGFDRTRGAQSDAGCLLEARHFGRPASALVGLGCWVHGIHTMAGRCHATVPGGSEVGDLLATTRSRGCHAQQLRAQADGWPPGRRPPTTSRPVLNSGSRGSARTSRRDGCVSSCPNATARTGRGARPCRRPEPVFDPRPSHPCAAR